MKDIEIDHFGTPGNPTTPRSETPDVVRAPFTENSMLGQITVGEFITVMTHLEQTKQYANAKKEHEIASRVFQDVVGITATAAHPFRIKTLDDVEKLHEMLTKAMKEGVEGDEIAVMLAIVSPPAQPTYKGV